MKNNKNNSFTKTALNAEISKVEIKIPGTGNLVTTTVLNTIINDVENRICNNSKYVTTREFNKLTAEHFTARLKQADLVNKIDLDNKLTRFNRRITSHKTKHLKAQKKLNSLITNNYNFLFGGVHFTSK